MIGEKGLLVGGVLSCIAAAVHVAIIFGGSSWYWFFGAGERMASMAEGGSLYPTLITLGIACVLFVWGYMLFRVRDCFPHCPC